MPECISSHVQQNERSELGDKGPIPQVTKVLSAHQLKTVLLLSLCSFSFHLLMTITLKA